MMRGPSLALFSFPPPHLHERLTATCFVYMQGVSHQPGWYGEQPMKGELSLCTFSSDGEPAMSQTNKNKSRKAKNIAVARE